MGALLFLSRIKLTKAGVKGARAQQIGLKSTYLKI